GSRICAALLMFTDRHNKIIIINNLELSIFLESDYFLIPFYALAVIFHINKLISGKLSSLTTYFFANKPFFLQA
ncbi:hypothetical protein MYX76_18595, partial [Desulfobacterota bacterium AH_259_B03_O07]|nr:hypothetical protein [Desulfobacterota bacterium AH_259_B03_O07]